MFKVFDSRVFLKTVTNQPGVYRMYDASKMVIYVGKAKDLKKRLASYFRKKNKSQKIEQLIKNVHQIDITVTHTEMEALLLEHNYIKLYQPRYNILLKDDKSYPYIFLSAEQHPRLTIHRGTINKEKGDYFGPFPSVRAVRETLSLLHKLFPLRHCEDNIYANRSRPCLQYQMNRCLAPCVNGIITDEEYQAQVEYVRLFLLGKNQQVLNQLIQNIEKASKTLQFESAARYRDQILAIRSVTRQQFIFDNTNNANIKNIDVISLAYHLGIACIQILFIREGKLMGSRSYYPKMFENAQLTEVLKEFLCEFYIQNRENYSLPSEILLDFLLPEKKFFANYLTKMTGRKINIQVQPRGIKAKYLKLARTNARTLLEIRIAQQSKIEGRMQALVNFLKLPKIYRIECFDVSHISGEQTVGSCVVFDAHGPLRSEYRRYNIINITPGDDYAAIYQVLMRRYNKEIDKSKVPDVIFIDGGKGQLAKAFTVFKTLKVNWDITRPKLIAVAKGDNRKAGLRKIFFKPDDEGFSLPADSEVLHLIENIITEAHNHAIVGHRHRREKTKNTSTLESIKGVGPKRRQMLLKYMGGLQGLRSAAIHEITKVPMISYALAEKIYNALKQ